MVLYLRCEGYGVGLELPATADIVAVRLSELKEGLDGAVKIDGVGSPIPNLGQYVKHVDPERKEDLEKLNALAKRIDNMTEREQQIFSGALDAESVGGLDDVLSIANSLDAYTFLPNICSDRDLGVFLVDTGYIDSPEHLRPYINYEGVGAEYYADFGGAYSPFGYVRRKDTEQQLDPDKKTVFTAHLQANDRRYILKLPASDAGLEAAKRVLGVDDFCEMELVSLEYNIPYLKEQLPQDCFSVVDADKLALEIESMWHTDGELLKYLSALCIEEPSTFQEALEIAYHIGDYERITEGTYEYGQNVLRRIGADDEIIDTIDGYMDFERFGMDMMDEDNVQQTEFGMVRRINKPAPSQQQGQIFQ